MKKIALFGVLFVAVMCACYFMVPTATVAADGNGHWGIPPSPTPSTHNDGFLVQAQHYNEFGEVDQTVTTGTAKNKRQARKASKALAKSLNSAGNGFMWEPGCEGLLCK